MNQFVRSLISLASLLGIFTVSVNTGYAQTQTSVFDPNDPVTIYNAAAPLAQPEFGKPGKWLKTTRISNWNTSSYKPYIYKGIAFRLKYPNNYDPSGNTKYPLYLFFHGRGEVGTIYDNEFQLYHGGDGHRQAVDNGKFNGFLLYPQNNSMDGSWTSTQRLYLTELIENFLAPELNVDIFRVVVDGLSAGGLSTWMFLRDYPALTAACLPISNSSSTYENRLIQNKFTPIWLFQGSLDLSPTPATSQFLRTVARRNGANFKYTEYASRGHECWNDAWAEADYYPFLNRAYKSNPWPLFGKSEFCIGTPINTTLGVSTGFTGYEWRKNGAVISGATTNTLIVTDVGTYDCRVRKGTSQWSEWSRIPVVLKYKTQIPIPAINVKGLASKVLPSTDGKTAIDLETPDGFLEYNWQKVGSASSTPLSTTNVLMGATVGAYKVKYKEAENCESDFSDPFTIVNANGPNKPDAVTNLIASALSYTTIKLTWSGNPLAANSATGFEIYESTKSGGPYSFVGIVPSTEFSFTRGALTPGAKYYYVIRSVNNTAAGDLSREASTTLQADKQPPTAPGNLHITYSSRNSVSLEWDESTDNVGVDRYEIYVNGVQYYATDETQYDVYNLQYGKSYIFTVRALDVAGNASVFSNQVLGQALSNGLSFKHYLGVWSKLPDFKKLTPALQGVTPNITLDNRLQNVNYAFLWEGYIRIPASGNYVFKTNSDDGSKLYLAPYDSAAVALVNNDGSHAAQDATGTTAFLAKDSVLPFAATFFQGGGGQNMDVYWQLPGTSTFVRIPDSAFIDKPVPLDGTAPARPTNLIASALAYNKIGLSWNDNSNNEKNFEVFRSIDSTSGFVTVALLPANATSYIDSVLQPATRYFYRVRSINQYGQSAFDNDGYGVNFSYYEQTGMAVLPNFSQLTPVLTGRSTGFNLSMRKRTENYAIRFTGKITLAASDSYKFYLNSDDGSRLYIDGSLVVNNDGLHGAGSYVPGTVSLTAGVHDIIVDYFQATGGATLEVYYSGTGIDRRLIPDGLLGDRISAATTLQAPPAPAVPSDVTAVGVSTSSIRVNWVNNAANATGIELYRSYNDNQNYVLLTTLSPTTYYYLDTALSPSSLFFYKVRVVNNSGNSQFSTEVSTRVLGVIPILTPIEHVYMKFGTQLVVPIQAVSASPVAISIGASNLPAFAQFDSVSNGRGKLTLNPTEAQQGTYNIVLYARNAQGDINTTSFALTVNTNNVPKLAALAPVSVNEGATKSVTLTATDADTGDFLSWSLGSNTPSFVKLTGNNRSATLSLTPGYANAGSYSVLVAVNDGQNGKDTASILVSVVDVPYNGPDDGTPPVGVKDFTGSYGDNTVKLTWVNAAYNAQKNEVYRANSVSGPYVILNPNQNNKDATSFIDSTVQGNKAYYYLVKTVNNNGSATSSRIQVIVPNRLPVITTTALIFAKSLTTTDLTITAVDDPGETVILSVASLPSFATFSSSGNGTGILHLTPNGSQIGSYTIQVSATDSYGASSSKTFTLTVLDKFITSTFVNFTNSSFLAPLPWNNFSVSGTTVYSMQSISNLNNETNVNTGMSLRLNDGWNVGTGNAITGNNSGVFPDVVLRSSYSGGGPKTGRISGLSQNLKYNLIFYGNRTSGADIYYWVGNDTVRLPIVNNVSNTVQLNGISPNASGIINFGANTVTGSGNVVLSALVIQSYEDQGIIFAPFGLKKILSTKNSTGFSWKSNERNLTGFEIWRSTSANGTFAKLPVTVAPDVFRFTDENLTSGATYFYKVKAIGSGGATSDFSETIAIATVLYAVNINFNDGSALAPNQAVPWNNIGTLLYNGFSLNNLINENSQYTGIQLSILSNFSGFATSNDLVTGNNSAYAPDNILKSYYYMVYGSSAKLQISGLSQVMKYNFIFFGSRSDNGLGQTGAYTVGDQTAILNAKGNLYNTAQINDIVPDKYGNAIITITPTIGGGICLLNSLTIQASPLEGTGVELSGRKAALNVGQAATLVESTDGTGEDLIEGDLQFSSYPNPFRDNVVLKIDAKKAQQKLVVAIKDFSGRTLYTKDLTGVPAGRSEYVLPVNAQSWKPGVYGLQIFNTVTGENRTIKILK